MQQAQINTFDQLHYPFNVQYVMLSNNVEIAYCDIGNYDETIVFIHGLGAYLPTWERNLEALSKKYRCIAIDLPGYGKSSKDYYDADIQFYAEYVWEFIDRLSLGKVILAGHSMGAEIAMRVSVLRPNQVKALTLVAPSGIETFSDGQREDFNLRMSKRIIRSSRPQQIALGLKKNFFKEQAGIQKMIDDRVAMIQMDLFDQYCHNVASGVAAVYNKSDIAELERIKTPALIFFGENDQLIPNRGINSHQTTSDIAEMAKQHIKGCHLTMVAECGHMVHYEKPEIFNRELSSFVDTLCS